MDAMTVDVTERIINMSENVGKLLTKIEYVEQSVDGVQGRVDKLAGELKDTERFLLMRIDSLKEDYEKRFSDIKSTLAKYSVGATLLMTLVAAVIKHFMGL